MKSWLFENFYHAFMLHYPSTVNDPDSIYFKCIHLVYIVVYLHVCFCLCKHMISVVLTSCFKHEQKFQRMLQS